MKIKLTWNTNETIIIENVKSYQLTSGFANIELNSTYFHPIKFREVNENQCYGDVDKIEEL